MKAPHGSKLALTTLGLALTAAAATYGALGATQLDSAATALREPIPG